MVYVTTKSNKTLKEKFITKSDIYTKEEAKVFSSECEQIADEFAIGFAEWLLIIYNEDIIYDAFSKEVLLEIFKKENDL